MKTENIITLNRALGILEGVSFGASESVRDAIACACDMIDEVLDKEREAENEKTKAF